MRFEEFDFDDTLLDALYYMGFEKATPIQEQAIPLILQNKDLIACAQTGTGKTAAFTLPIINTLTENPTSASKTLIICPTRELAIQIEQQIQGFSYFTGVNSMAIYGGGDGNDWTRQKKALKEGCNIVVATPGKLMSHLSLGHVDFSKIEHLVLDEADRMLDMGFINDIRSIVSHLPKTRQTLMFSATMAPKIRGLAQELLKEPESISIALDKPAEGVLQAVYMSYNHQKTPTINTLIKDKPDYKSILIFTSTRRNVSIIAKDLKKSGHEVEGISSDLDQHQREDVLNQFRAKKLRILVATDILSRGIDIKDINLVINYDVPGDAADYVHRVGRTARASTTGVAITFVNEDDMYKYGRIEQLIEQELIKLPIAPELGEQPKYDPKFRAKRGGGGNNRHGGKGRGKGKGQGGNRKNNNSNKGRSNNNKSEKPKR